MVGCASYGTTLLLRHSKTLSRYPFISNSGFKFWKIDDNEIGEKYLVQKDNETYKDNTNTVLPYYRVYNTNGNRDCPGGDKTDVKFDALVGKFINPNWQPSVFPGGGPRPKKTKKQAVLPDGKIYDLFKSGNKWYVERECQSGTKKLVLVHPKK